MDKLKGKKLTVDVLLMMLLIVVSAFPRVWNLVSKPPIIVDETANLRDINEILTSGVYNPIDFHWDFSKTQLLYTPTILLIEMMGRSNDLLALRLISVIFSLLSLVPFYLLAKGLSNRLVAFSITLLFSYSYFFLQFSRVGWTNIIFVTSFGLYLFWFLSLWRKKDKLLCLVISGIIAGLIFYSYRAGIVYIGVSGLFLLFSTIEKKLNYKKSLGILFAFVVPFLMITTPWILKISQNLDLYNLRYRAVSIKNVQIPYHNLTKKDEIIRYQLTTSIKSWIFLQGIDGGGDENPRYLPLRNPPVNNVIRISFLIGIMIAFTKIKKTYLWLLVIVAGIFLGQVLTVNPPNGARGLILLPFIFLTSSLTINLVYEKVKQSPFKKMIILIMSLLIAYCDFCRYQNWMTWIQV